MAAAARSTRPGRRAPTRTCRLPPRASSASLVQFLKGLVTTEVGEPLQVGTFEPPRAETAEPEKLD